MHRTITGVKSLVVLFALMACCTQTVLAQSKGKLVWADEFDKAGLPDSSKWSYDIGDGCPNVCGWGNNELQYYTVNRKENARVENGYLIIEAKKEEHKGYHYTSARLVSKGKGDWTYGRMDIRARLPYGRGIWPAIWMLPTDWKYGGWPKSGEIDIMEFVGFMPDSVFGTVHTDAYNGMKETQKSKGLHMTDLATVFHLYSIEWTPEKISFLVDDQVYHVFHNEKKGTDAWPFDQRFHLLLNVAVGGNWGGKKGVDEKIFPQRMEVDYVRVYENTSK